MPRQGDDTMMIRRTAAVLIGGLFLAPLSTMAQSTSLAYATGQPRSEYMVFLDKGASPLPATAAATIRTAARAAAGKTIHVSGRAEHAQIVKQELIRDGIPATSIFVYTDPAPALVRTSDGISSPNDRRVDIKF
jgi:hypothetical protein